MREFVNEALHGKRDAVAPRCAQCARWHARRHHRRFERKVLNECRRELRGRDAGARREAIAFAERHEVIAPRGNPAAHIHATREVVPACRTIEIVLHVVFTRPEQLHRCGHLLGNPRRLDHVVVAQPTSKAATRARDVQRDVVFLNAEHLSGEPAAALRLLRWRPQLELAVLEMRRGVLRLERCVRDERVEIRRFNRLGRSLECRVEVAVLAQRTLCRRLGQCPRLRRERVAALCGRRAFVPRDLEFLTGALRLPPAVGHNRHAAHEPRELHRRGAVHNERVLHARLRLDLVEIGAHSLAAEHGTFLKHGVQHARHRKVDAEQRRAGHDLVRVHARLPRADDLVVFRVLELHRGQIRRHDRRGLVDEFAIREPTVARRVQHGACGCGALRVAHAPRLRRRRHQHGAPRCTHSAHRIPVLRRGRAAAGALIGEVAHVEHPLLDAHVLPFHVEFVGNDHWQHVLHALPDFRVLGDDRDDAVRRDLDVGVRCKVRRAQTLGPRRSLHGRVEERGEQHAAAREGGHAQELAAVDG